MITTECVQERCQLWARRCSVQKHDQELIYKKKKKPAPEWVCKWPYPGANVDMEDEYAIKASRYKKN